MIDHAQVRQSPVLVPDVSDRSVPHTLALESRQLAARGDCRRINVSMAVHIVDGPGLDAMAKTPAVVVLRWDSTAERNLFPKVRKMLSRNEQRKQQPHVPLRLVEPN